MRGQPSGGDGSTGLDAVIEALGLASYRELLAARWEESAVAGPLPGWPAEGQIREACAFAAFPAELTDACLACREWVARSPLRLKLLWHGFRVLFHAPGASAGLAQGFPTLAELDGPAPLFGALLCLCAVPQMRALHASRSIPEAVTVGTLRDLALWILEHRRTSGTLGFSQMAWLWHHLTGRLVQLGRLQFGVATFGQDYHVFRSGDGETTVLAGHGMRFRSDGQFANADGKEATSGVRDARFVETQEGWEGERIDALGFSTGERTMLPRSRWSELLGRGGPVIGVHIPAGGEPPGNGPMADQACASSFEDAAPFFARHFPEHGARALTCHSWLMDPQLRLYLPEAANIILFQKRFYLLPAERAGPAPHFERVFGVPAPRDAAELDELERKIGFAGRRSSAVERALIEHMRRGLVWRSGAGLIPLAASPSA